MNTKDIKLLWGRSGNRCAICRIQLTQDGSSNNSSFTLGEQAHIVGESELSPRGKSLLTVDERNSYHNLILLCPNHHTQIDKNENDWPIEKLHDTKSRHELWVLETLGESTDRLLLAENLSIKSIIDAALALCNFEDWSVWTSHALSHNHEWPANLPDKVILFRQKIMATVWPESYQEIRKSAITLSTSFSRLAITYLQHVKQQGDSLIANHFYKSGGWNENYHEDLIKFEKWESECNALLIETTKAANWFADSIRKEFDPLFLVDKGKFIITNCICKDIYTCGDVPEFSEKEKQSVLKRYKI